MTTTHDTAATTAIANLREAIATTNLKPLSSAAIAAIAKRVGTRTILDACVYGQTLILLGAGWQVAWRVTQRDDAACFADADAIASAEECAR